MIATTCQCADAARLRSRSSSVAAIAAWGEISQMEKTAKAAALVGFIAPTNHTVVQAATAMARKPEAAIHVTRMEALSVCLPVCVETHHAARRRSMIKVSVMRL